MTELLWDDRPAVGVRWNGEVGKGFGNPQSRGLPTWFILPEPLAKIALDCVSEHLRVGDSSETTEALPPRHRLLDLISFVRAASDEELKQMIEQMGLRTAKRS
jgi:hypothetical protein